MSMDVSGEISESECNKLTLYSSGGIVGASVSALVYTSLIQSGKLASSAVSSGISLSGTLVGYGAELIAGEEVADIIRQKAAVTSLIVKPHIEESSRRAATHLSVLAGGASAVATSFIMYSTSEAKTYIKQKVNDYVSGCKHYIAQTIQQPVELLNDSDNSVDSDNILFIDDT